MCYRLDDRELTDPGCNSRISKHGRPRNVRRDLLEQFYPFPAQAVLELDKAGGVTAWARQALDEPSADRVGDVDEYDWYGARRLQERSHGGRASCQDDI